MHPLGRIGDSITSQIAWVKQVGVRSALRRIFIRVLQNLGFPEPESWRVRPHQALHPLIARLRNSSDMDVFHQIFTAEEYSPLKNMKNISLVLDLGANVGYSSVYFLSCFPNAIVVAVEPDEFNVEVCRINLKPYGDRALLLHGAVWTERTMLCLSRGSYGDGREWATQVVLPSRDRVGYVQAWDVGSLIDMAGAEMVDLLKVDIERAELAVFGESAKTWIPRVRNICIELHGPDCQKAFFNALAGFDYELEYSGELTICRNICSRTESD